MIHTEIANALEQLHYEIRTTDDEHDLWQLIGIIDELKVKAVTRLLRLAKADRDSFEAHVIDKHKTQPEV